MMYVHMDHIDPDIADTGSVYLCLLCVCILHFLKEDRHFHVLFYLPAFK